MKRERGLTLAEVVIAVLVMGLAVAFLLYAMAENARQRRLSRTIRCRSNLNQLCKGMATYLNELGDNRFYPWPAGRPGCGGNGAKADFGGAEWLAALYWTKTIPDPGVFICPCSLDDCGNGAALGRNGCSGPGFVAGPDGKLRPDAVSYAAMGSTSVAVYKREKLGTPVATNSAIRDDFPPNEPMACDGTEGEVNHGTPKAGSMSVLFFDSHCELWTQAKIDLERGVGMKGTELVAFRN